MQSIRYGLRKGLLSMRMEKIIGFINRPSRPICMQQQNKTKKISSHSRCVYCCAPFPYGVLQVLILNNLGYPQVLLHKDPEKDLMDFGFRTSNTYICMAWYYATKCDTFNKLIFTFFCITPYHDTTYHNLKQHFYKNFAKITQLKQQVLLTHLSNIYFRLFCRIV